MGGKLEKGPITLSFREAMEIGTIEQWHKGLDVLADIVWRMDRKSESKAWGRAGKNFRNKVNSGEIVVVGDFGFLAKRGRNNAIETPMSVYPEIAEKEGVVLFVINRNALDINKKGGKEIARREAYTVNSSLSRLREVKNKGINILRVNEIDDERLGDIGLSCPLNSLLEEKIKQFYMLG